MAEEDGRKRFRDRRAAARVNNGTTSFREARRRWMSARVCTRACMREVLIGSVREGGAQKQPSGQTSQHQSAPVTRARTIGANIAILPAFTFDGEKDNDGVDRYCVWPASDSKSRLEAGNDDVPNYISRLYACTREERKEPDRKEFDRIPRSKFARGTTRSLRGKM